MSAKDLIHDAVKAALIKDGWTITHDPYTIEFAELTLSADLAAERPFAAERGSRKIIVEVKSFTSRSPVHDLKNALGQYDLYVAYLELLSPEREVYLAVSHLVYQDFFKQNAVQFIVRRYNLKLLVVHVAQEEVVTWIN
jgi:hypothetical protein